MKSEKARVVLLIAAAGHFRCVTLHVWLGKKGASKAFRHDFKWKKRNSISEAAHFFICQIHHAIRDSVYVVMKKIPYYVHHNSWRNYSRIYGVVPFFSNATYIQCKHGFGRSVETNFLSMP